MWVACRSRLPRARSYRIVVRGSGCGAASCRYRRGISASGAAVLKACLSVRGVTVVAVAARRAAVRTGRPAPCRSGRRPSAARNTGPSARSPGGQVDRPGGARRRRDGHHVAGLAGTRRRPVPALQARLLDAGPSGLRHPRPGQREQRRSAHARAAGRARRRPGARRPRRGPARSRATGDLAADGGRERPGSARGALRRPRTGSTRRWRTAAG